MINKFNKINTCRSSLQQVVVFRPPVTACLRLSLAPSPTLSPTDPVPRGQLWLTGSVGNSVAIPSRSCADKSAVPNVDDNSLSSVSSKIEEVMALVVRSLTAGEHSVYVLDRAVPSSDKEGSLTPRSGNLPRAVARQLKLLFDTVELLHFERPRRCIIGPSSRTQGAGSGREQESPLRHEAGGAR